MKRLLYCTLSILAVAAVLGIGIWLTTLKPSPARALMREHPYVFSETKEWGKAKKERYVESGGCVFLCYPKTDNKETMEVINGFLAEAKDCYLEFAAEDTARIPRLAIDYTAEKKAGYISLILTYSIGSYKEDGQGTDTLLGTRYLYLNEKGTILDLEALLGEEKQEKLKLLLDRQRLSDEEPVSFTYSEDQVTLKWTEEEITFTMEEIERAGKIDPDKPMIALTFDDGPGQYTKQFADLLTRYNGHATFFMLGMNVGNYKESVKYAYDQGHEIASHTMRHKNLNLLSVSDAQKEVEDADFAIQAITGEKPKLVRPPYGNANSKVASIINRPIINWNLDTEDWRTRDAQAVKQAILDGASDGAIILMHEIYESTYEGLSLALDELVKEGYQFVSVSELIEYRQVAAGVHTYYSFPKN